MGNFLTQMYDERLNMQHVVTVNQTFTSGKLCLVQMWPSWLTKREISHTLTGLRNITAATAFFLCGGILDKNQC